MKVPEFLSTSSKKVPTGIQMTSTTVVKNPYTKLEPKDIKDELDQPTIPLHPAPPSNKSSTLQAFGNTIKSFVGVGMLVLPYAIRNSGLTAGIIGLIVIGILSNYTMKALIRCKLEMELRRKFVYETNRQQPSNEEQEISYGLIGKHIFGRLGLYLVNFAIMTSQLGFCCAYIQFIGENLDSVFNTINREYYAFILFPIFVFLSWIRNIKYLAPTSILANGVLVFAVGVIFYYGFSQLKLEANYPHFHISTFPLFFGIAVFGFEGINLAIPIQSSMANPRAYPRMLDLSLLCVGIMYILFGTLVYLFYGDRVEGIITKNLPDSPIATIVRIALCLELLLSYPVQLFPVTLIVEDRVLRSSESWTEVKRNVIRALLVTITVVTAVTIPHFELFTSLIGSFSNSMVVFIFPPLFLISIFRGRLAWWEVVFNVCILAFGIAAAAVSSAISIIELINAMK